jgi:hypothetical protein
MNKKMTLTSPTADNQGVVSEMFFVPKGRAILFMISIKLSSDGGSGVPLIRVEEATSAPSSGKKINQAASTTTTAFDLVLVYADLSVGGNTYRFWLKPTNAYRWISLSIILRNTDLNAYEFTNIYAQIDPLLGVEEETAGSASNLIMKTGDYALATGLRTKAVVFTTPFPQTCNRVVCWTMRSGGAEPLRNIDANALVISTTGFTAHLGIKTPDNLYRIGYIAFGD